MLAMILILQESGRDDKDIWLYDTFEGMTEPTEYDVSAFDRPAQKRWEQDSGRPWPTLFGSETFNEEGVRELLIGTGYPEEQLHFVRGPVEQLSPTKRQNISLSCASIQTGTSRRATSSNTYSRGSYRGSSDPR